VLALRTVTYCTENEETPKYPSAKVRAFVDFLAAEFAAGNYERKWTGYMGLQSAG
jgi:hypothetical protein